MKLAVAVTVAHVTRYVSQLLLLVVASSLGGTESVAAVVLAFAIATPIFIVAGLGYRILILTHNYNFSFPTLLMVRVIASLAASVASFAVATAFSTAEVAGFVALVSITKSADQLQELWATLLQRDRRLKAMLIVALASGFLCVSVLLATAYLTQEVQTTVLATGLAAVVAAVLAGTLLRWPTISRNIGARAEVWALISAGVPLGVSFAVIGALANTPQYLTAALSSPAATAQTGIYLYLIIAGDMVANPLAQAWLHRAKRSVLQARHFGKWYLRETLVITLGWIPFSVLVVGAGWLLIPFVFGPEYVMEPAEALVVFGVVTLLPAVYLGGAGLGVLNRYRSSLLVSVPSLVAALSAGLLLVPLAAVPGALAALLVGYSLRALIPAILIRSLGRPTT